MMPNGTSGTGWPVVALMAYTIPCRLRSGSETRRTNDGLRQELGRVEDFVRVLGVTVVGHRQRPRLRQSRAQSLLEVTFGPEAGRSIDCRGDHVAEQTRCRQPTVQVPLCLLERFGQDDADGSFPPVGDVEPRAARRYRYRSRLRADVDPAGYLGGPVQPAQPNDLLEPAQDDVRRIVVGSDHGGPRFRFIERLKRKLGAPGRLVIERIAHHRDHTRRPVSDDRDFLVVGQCNGAAARTRDPAAAPKAWITRSLLR